MLKNAIIEEATCWEELTDLVVELEEQILKIEAKLADGQKSVVFERL